MRELEKIIEKGVRDNMEEKERFLIFLRQNNFTIDSALEAVRAINTKRLTINV